jgi:uncharacterized protein (TIGR04141 family)
MPRQHSNTRRTTIYALRRPDELRQCITAKYRDSEGFTLAPVVVGDIESLLVTGTIERDQADWCPVVSGYTGKPISLGNRNAVCVVLVPLGDRVFALAYGLGFLVLESELCGAMLWSALRHP